MELRQAIEGSDLADIQSKTAALEDASRGLADVLYAQAAQAQAGAQTSGNGGSSDDEVVEDADYEVIDEEEATKS
jgi:molecular chaperone DnaK